jgi:serine/threonine protein kinase
MRVSTSPAGVAWAVPVPIGYQVGDWEVAAGIATGSWASVYAARRCARGDPAEAALKFMATSVLSRRHIGPLRDMIERELAVHRGANHSRLIRCHEIHEVNDVARPELDGSVVLVLDRAERSLAEVIADHRGTPTPGAGALIEQICEGLDHMHREGWVHGDLKPANVLVMADGSVRLADFGLAAQIEGTHGYLPPLASWGYVPPERWTDRIGERGLPARATADVWALGVIAYELLTGLYPFSRAGGRTRVQYPADLPLGWRSFLADCLAPTHAERARHGTASLLARIRAMTTSSPQAGPRSSFAIPAVVGPATVVTETVLVQYGAGAGKTEVVRLAPGGTVRFGRGAPGSPVDVALTDPAVPRLAGEIRATDDYWTLSNFSHDRSYVVENPEGGGEHIKVTPRRLAAPIPFEISRVVLPSSQAVVTFSVFAPMQTYADEAPVNRGVGTVAAFCLDESAKYFLVLVALCEPRLRDESWMAIPTVQCVVERLRPLPACTGLTPAAVAFHIDYLARTKLRIRPELLHGRAGRLAGKTAALVSLALRFNLVREDHLGLLPARMRRA